MFTAQDILIRIVGLLARAFGWFIQVDNGREMECIYAGDTGPSLGVLSDAPSLELCLWPSELGSMAIPQTAPSGSRPDSAGTGVFADSGPGSLSWQPLPEVAE